MKKLLLSLFSFLILVMCVTSYEASAANSAMKLIVNGKSVVSPGPAVFVEGITYVPLTAFLKSVNCTIQQSEDKSYLIVTHNWENSGVFSIKPEANYSLVLISGQDNPHTLLFKNLPFTTPSGTTYIALSDIGSLLGAKYSVDIKNKKISVTVSNTTIKNALINRYNSNPETRSPSEIVDLNQPKADSGVVVSTPTPSGNVIKAKIDSDFEGFEEGNVYELSNGQYWKQTSYQYEYHYAYRPEAIIYKDGFRYYMVVEKMDKTIEVKLIGD